MSNPAELYNPVLWSYIGSTSTDQHTEGTNSTRIVHRASTAFPSKHDVHPPALHPRMLMPGNRGAINQRPDLFFQQPPTPPPSILPRSTTFSLPTRPIPPTPTSTSPVENTAGDHFSINRSNTPPPPLPPLPPSLRAANLSARPKSSSGSLVSASSLPPFSLAPSSEDRPSASLPPVPPKPASLRFESEEISTETIEKTDDEDDLAKILALSASESQAREVHLKVLWEQEEDELARAMEESLKVSKNHEEYDIRSNQVASSSFHSFPLPLTVDWSGSKQTGSSTPTTRDFPRSLSPRAHGKDREIPGDYASVSGPNEEDELSSPSFTKTFGLSQSDEAQITSDEELARQLAAEEEDKLEQSQHEEQSVRSFSTLETKRSLSAIDSSSTVSESSSRPLLITPTTLSLTDVDNSQFQESPESRVSKLPQEHETSGHHPEMHSVNSELPSYGSVIAAGPPSTRSDTPGTVDHPSPDLHDTTSLSTTVSDDYFAPSIYDSSETSAESPTISTPLKPSFVPTRQGNLIELSRSTGGAVNPNQFVEPELFMGVSLGFVPPTLSAELVPMRDAMPNLVELPYLNGRFSPLHIQSPNWRQLLRLLAKLSTCRLQAEMEAMAVAKAELKLRVIIQFIKPHHLGKEWRTIVWLTLDLPPPQAGRHPKNDVNVLPYSYTLGQRPTLLQETADTPISKIYVVPETDRVPYPTMPLTFPHLALYLQAALEESRRYLNDSSSGMRKLAKMVSQCYPAQVIDTSVTDPPTKGGRKWLPWKKAKSKQDANTEMYLLVTPFLPDHDHGE